MRMQNIELAIGATIAPAYHLIAQPPHVVSRRCAKRLTKCTCAGVDVCSMSYTIEVSLRARTPFANIDFKSHLEVMKALVGSGSVC